MPQKSNSASLPEGWRQVLLESGGMKKKIYFWHPDNNFVQEARPVGRVKPPGPQASRTLDGFCSLSIISAEGLKGHGKSGKCENTFVVVKNDSLNKLVKVGKTAVKKGTTTPQFKSEPMEFVVNSGRVVLIQLYEYNMLKRDNLCGYVMIDLCSQMDGEEHLLELKVVPEGKVKLSLKYTDDACLFGMDLEGAVARSGDPIPTIIRKCVEYIEEKGMDCVDIYHSPGKANTIARMIDVLEDHQDLSIFSFEELRFKVTAKDVASLLLRYLELLPEPLFTHAMYPIWIRTIKSISPHGIEGRLAMQTRYNRLLQVNRSVVTYLLNHLRKVADHSDANGLNVDKLAAIFGPVLLHPAESAVQQVLNAIDTDAEVCVVRYLLDGWPLAFDSINHAGESAAIRRTQTMRDDEDRLKSGPPTTLPPPPTRQDGETADVSSNARKSSPPTKRTPPSIPPPVSTTGNSVEKFENDESQQDDDSELSGEEELPPLPLHSRSDDNVLAKTKFEFTFSPHNMQRGASLRKNSHPVAFAQPELNDDLPPDLEEVEEVEELDDDEEEQLLAAAEERMNYLRSSVVNLMESHAPPTLQLSRDLQFLRSSFSNLDDDQMERKAVAVASQAERLFSCAAGSPPLAAAQIEIIVDDGVTDSKQQAAEKFLLFDPYETGVLNEDAVTNLLRRLKCPPAQKEITAISEESGTLTLSQFQQIWAKHQLDRSDHWVSVLRNPSGMNRHRTLLKGKSDKPDARSLFRKYPRDALGGISFDSFRKLCEDLHHQFRDDDEFAVLVRFLDTNGDQSISFAEFSRWYDSNNHFERLTVSEHDMPDLTASMKHFYSFDLNKDGRLDRDEFAMLHAHLVWSGYQLDDMDTVLQELDSNRDGFVSFNDYIEWLMELGSLQFDKRV